MASANLFQSYLQAPKSVLDYQDEFARSDALKNQNAMQSLALQQASAKTSQDLAERNALQRIAAGWSSNTSPDQRAGDLYNSGLPGLIAQGDSLKKTAIEQQKGAASAAKDQAEADAKTAEIKWKLADRHAQQLNMVQTPEDAVAYIDEGIREGSLPMQGRDRAIAMIQQNGVQAWKQMASQSAVPVLEKFKQDAEQRRAQLTADTQIKTTGMNNATSRANTAATQAGEDRRSANQVTYQTDASGNMVAVPSRVAPGTTVQGQPVLDSGGKAIPGKSNLTETQGKATTFAARMADAESTIKAMEAQGVSGSDFRTMAAGSPLTNWAASPEGQQYRQAQENWVTANLRQESGAAIGKDEMAKDVRKFFPTPGDSAAVKEQKARSRVVAQQGMLTQAGPGATQVSRILSNAGAPAASNGWTVQEVK
jgi:hypothetical protein